MTQTIHVDGAEGDCDTEAERKLEAAAEEAVRHGYEPTPEARALAAIYGKAVSHDRSAMSSQGQRLAIRSPSAWPRRFATRCRSSDHPRARTTRIQRKTRSRS